MLPKISIRSFIARFSKLITSSRVQVRAIINEYHSLDEFGLILPSTGRSTSLAHTYFPFRNQRRCMPDGLLPGAPCIPCQIRVLLGQRRIFMSCDNLFPRLHVRHVSNSLVELKTADDVVKFSFGTQPGNGRIRRKVKKTPRQVKMSKRAKLNELRFYRLKANKKMNSPNPEVRIRYKLDKSKRKEEWLIEKLRKFNVPKAPDEPHDPEILTEEERFYLKRTGEKKKNYVPVGRRGVFGGVVLNMHLHWKNNETVKVVCKPCKPGQIHTYAEELARLSKGIVIGIKPNNTIIFFRGKNYVQPKVMSPPDTLSKAKAMEKYKFEQSLEHVSSLKNLSTSWKSIISTWLDISKGRKRLRKILLQCSPKSKWKC